MSCSCSQKHVPAPRQYMSLTTGGIEHTLCPTSFYNIMDLLAHYRANDGEPPGSVRKHYSTFVQYLAWCMYEEVANPTP